MKIIFYGGKQAGMIALLTLLAKGEEVVCVIPEKDGIIEQVAKNLNLNFKKPEDINSQEFVDYLRSLAPDLFVCCHGRQILKKDILSIGAVNIHPCLYKYKGANPIGRMLADKEKKASVGVHWMREKLDQGEVIIEKFLELEDCSSIEQVYNQLYSLYSQALVEALDKIKEKIC